jgi:prepilin-type N-terminal cleavage/methylation domain-containing protein
MKMHNSDSGFSLVELLMALMVTLVLMASAYMMLNDFQKQFSIEQELTAMRQNMRLAVDYIAGELRDAGNNPNGANLTAIQGDPNGDNVRNDIRIQKDVNPPDDLRGSNVSDPWEDITISFDGTNKVVQMRDNIVGGAATPIVDEHITNLTFTLLRLDGTVTTVNNQAASVRIQVDAATKILDPRTRAVRTETLVSDVRLQPRRAL